MSKLNLTTLDDYQKVKLVDARWRSSSDLWEIVEQTYQANTAIYSNQSSWIQSIPFRRQAYIVQDNRIFVNMEAVINSLIANPPGINILPAREGDKAQDFARKLESFLRKKFLDINSKETLRKGLRNLYFGRLLVIKPFWNPVLGEGGDFDFRAIDPRKIRVAKYATKEQDSEFAIEEIEDNLCAVIERFPAKREELMKKFGIQGDSELYIRNPDVKYKEAWINDYVIFKLDDIILGTMKNPYWDWEGILITDEEEAELKQLEGENRRNKLQSIKLDQDSRKVDAVASDDGGEVLQTGDVATKYKPFLFNYFSNPRKPYIIATIFNNENSPIGRTDMITLSAQLQRGIDKRKMDIDENCDFVNGILKVDAEVMGKSDAQRIRWETKGIIWGKGVKDGVIRETGAALPQMVFDDMIDSRSEIDNIMAASSAFRGEREGQETKAGRLALIQQSYLRLNELVQVVDYVSKEMFDWAMQLSKTRYTEYHYAKWMGKEGGREMIEIIQDDFEDGSEVTIIAGKTLPKDDEFKFEQAQNDVEKGYISPADYLEIAQYDNAKELAQNNVLYKQNPAQAVGLDMNQLPLPFAPGGLTPAQVSATAPADSPQITPTEMQPEVEPVPIQ